MAASTLPTVAKSAAAQFRLNSDAASLIPPPALTKAFLWEYICDGRTPARAMTDVALRDYLPAIEGEGVVVELGAGSDYYKKYATAGQAYVTSNIVDGLDAKLDMTSIDLPANSIDATCSVYALEHIYEYQKAIDEQYRVLAPGGRMLLVVPFMYYYHAAPDDFFRFSASALDRMLARFKVLRRQAIGGRWLIFAEFLHEKKVMGSRKGTLARFFLRSLAMPFLAVGLKQHDSQYALCFVYLCEKPI